MAAEPSTDLATPYDDWIRRYSEEEDDPDAPVGTKNLAALRSYLNDITGPSEASHIFKNNVAESEAISANLLWSLLIDASKEFPEAHEKLIVLLDRFSHQSTFEKGTAQNAAEELLISDFTFELHESYKGTESYSLRSDSTARDERHYINLCAFTARFWHAQHEDWTVWALNLVSTALEEEHREALTNLFGQAVAQLFIFSGQEMFAISKMASIRGPLFLEEIRTSPVSRWEFWKKRFHQLMESERLSNETQGIFATALGNLFNVEAEG